MKFFLLFGFPYIQGSHYTVRISHKVHDHLLTIFGVKPQTVFYKIIMYISKSKIQQATLYPCKLPKKPLWDSLESSSLRSIDQFVFERQWSLNLFKLSSLHERLKHLFSILWGKLHWGRMRKLKNDSTEKSFRTMSLKTSCLMIFIFLVNILSVGHFRSPKNPHFQKEAKYTTFLVKMNFFARVKNHSYIKGWVLNVVLKQGQGELENGVWVSQGKRWGPLEGRREKGMSAKIRLSSCVGAQRLYRSRSR